MTLTVKKVDTTTSRPLFHGILFNLLGLIFKFVVFCVLHRVQEPGSYCAA